MTDIAERLRLSISDFCQRTQAEMDDLRRENERLRGERAELLAVLKAYIADYENPLQTCHNGFTAECARAAIDEAEGRG